MSFKGVDESYEECDRHIFKQNEFPFQISII